MKFSIPLPVDNLYCPKLTCQVFDNIFKGFNQPLIGVFTVPVGELMLALKKERKEETEIIEEINQKLEKILRFGNYEPKDYINASIPNDQTGASNNFNGSEARSYYQSSNKGSINETEIDRDDSVPESQKLLDAESSQNSLVAKKKRKPKNADVKKKIQKSLKGSEIIKEGAEQLGANENQGNDMAFQSKMENLEIVKERKNRILSKKEFGGMEDDAIGGFGVAK